jgi:tRNA A-37 threonylcarbamoyl transferase component Bud32
MADRGAPVRPGDLILGKYRVEEVLGSGGMGVVVAARHEQLEQRVAIKFVRDEALGNDEAVQRFLREARAAVKLRSEHVARVIDVGTLESGSPYMVMELLEGADLAHILEDRGPLPLETVAEWIVQACEAVAEAHATGIVHRDIKPQNLFLARTVGGASKIKVLDFGVSKADASVGALTQTKAMLGSPLYMSPEQMRSARSVDARADVWALGVVMFELLSQRWPFEAETMPELCLRVVTDPPNSLAALRPELPALFVDVVERCLEKDPMKRYANAAELASALEAFAPPASRIIAERARMAISSLSDTKAAAAAADPAAPNAPSGGKQPVDQAAARTALTPAAWGSGRHDVTARGRRRRSLVLWIGLGAALVGGAATFIVVRSSHGSASTAATSATAPADSSSTAAHAAVVAPPTASLEPSAPATADTPVASAVSTVTADAGPAAVSSGTAAPWWAGKPPPHKPGTTAPTNKPGSGRDSDIPALR